MGHKAVLLCWISGMDARYRVEENMLEHKDNNHGQAPMFQTCNQMTEGEVNLLKTKSDLLEGELQNSRL